jgi:outer membrane murein-binding lipoprotein Lpp
MVELPNYKPVSGWIYLKWIIIAVAIGLLAYFSYAYLNHVEPGYSMVAGLGVAVSQVNLQGIFDFITQNAALIGAGISASIFLVGLIREHAKKVQVTEQAQMFQSQADQRIGELYTDNQQLVQQVKKLEANASNTAYETYESTIKTLSGQKTELESQVKSLTRQTQELMNKLANTPVKIVKVRD